MPATIELRSYHEATPNSGVNVAGGTLRFKTADNDVVDANNPVPVPAAGTNYSFIKQLRFYAATTPDNLINGLEFYTDGTAGYGTGVGVNAKTEASYTDPITLGASDMGNAVDAFTYTSGSALAISGSLTNPSTGAFGDYLKLQMTVADTAAQGNTATESMTFSYDES